MLLLQRKEGGLGGSLGGSLGGGLPLKTSANGSLLVSGHDLTSGAIQETNYQPR